MFSFFILFFSTFAFAEVEIYIGDREVECAYNQTTGATVCEYVNASGDTPGVWNPKTFSCTNFVAPVIDATGEITCPPINKVKVADSTSTPNPSEDDLACDPTKAPDPNNPDSGCASQKTLATTNDLLSESNSKLGSIASSNATNTSLLSGILGTLQGIASQGQSPDSNCPPPNVSAPSCPDGQVAGYYNHEFTCVSSNGISCIGDACRTIIVSDCGVTDTASGSGGSSGGSGSDGLGSGFTDTVSIPNSSSFQPMISGTGSCPAPETFTVLGTQFELSYESFCDFAESIRFIVIALGAFSALLIVVTAL